MEQRWKCVYLDLVDDEDHTFRWACRKGHYTNVRDSGTVRDDGPRHEHCGVITPIGAVVPPNPGGLVNLRG